MRANDDVERVILAYVVALEVANATIGASGACVADLRQRLATGLGSQPDAGKNQ